MAGPSKISVWIDAMHQPIRVEMGTRKVPLKFAPYDGSKKRLQSGARVSSARCSKKLRVDSREAYLDAYINAFMDHILILLFSSLLSVIIYCIHTTWIYAVPIVESWVRIRFWYIHVLAWIGGFMFFLNVLSVRPAYQFYELCENILALTFAPLINAIQA